MSYEAMRWAMSQPVAKSSAKFVLVAMADCVNGDGPDMRCWPSVQHLSETTGQDRKTVIDGLRRLREAGFIHDTKERRGQTGQVPVFLLKTPENGTVKAVSHTSTTSESNDGNSPENGTGTESGTVPLLDGNSPVFPYEQSRFSLSTVPKTGHGTSKEPIKNQEGTRKSACAIPGVPDSLLADYMAVRKAKRAGPLTETAIAGLLREAGKAGITAETAVRACCEFGWQGFNAGWYADRQPKAKFTKTTGGRSFRELDYHEGSTNGVPDA